MLIPPEIICIKRKREDEAPVEILHLEPNSKRHLTEGSWIYYRADGSVPTSIPASSPAPAPASALAVEPTIHVWKPSKALPGITPVAQNAATKTGIYSAKGDLSTLTDGEPSRLNPTLAGKMVDNGLTADTRQFRISRGSMYSKSSSGKPNPAQVSKKHTLVFVECDKPKKHRPSQAYEIQIAAAPAAIVKPCTTTIPLRKQNGITEINTIRDLEATRTADSNPCVEMSDIDRTVPSSIDRQDGNGAVKTVGAGKHYGAKETMEGKMDLSNYCTKAAMTRFKPKAPAMRYGERYSTVVQQTLSRGADHEMSSSDEGENVVIDTYRRVRVHGNTVQNSTHIGLLVLENDEDYNVFYTSGLEREEEQQYDEEDENAENYYGADYPEDESDSDDEGASDDEFGRGLHRHGRDFEPDNEFDRDDDDDDDDDLDHDFRHVFEGESDKVILAKIEKFQELYKGN